MCLITSTMYLLNLGRVLNRFSKDVGFLDDLMPYVFCEFILVSKTGVVYLLLIVPL